MSDINVEVLTAVVSAITKKSWLDYVSTFLLSLAPLATLVVSWKIFSNQYKQSVRNKVVESDVERLYGAADLFFEYSDALNLYLSMVIIKHGILQNGKEVPESVDTKVTYATDDVFPKINSVYKSYFFLRSLGADDIAEQVSDYREKTIKFRKKIFEIVKCKTGDDFHDVTSERELIASIKGKRDLFTQERDEILVKIAEYKKILIKNSLK